MPSLSLANKVNKLMLYSSEGLLLDMPGPFKTIEQELISRLFGLLLTPAALGDCILHTITLAFAYSEKIQRIRDSAFGILFGSVFGLVHPYMGCYAVEPVKKHIAAGILLSGSSSGFKTVCSPVTSIEEASSLGDKITDNARFSDEERKLLKQVSYYEKLFEKTQSLEFFSLSLTSKVYSTINNLDISSPLNEVIKRVSLVAFPVFIVLDLLFFGATSVVCLGMLPISLFRCEPSAYMETAASIEVIIANLGKIPLFLISATFGFVASWIDPEFGQKAIQKGPEFLLDIFFTHQMNTLYSDVKAMQRGERMLLPAADFSEDNSDSDLSFIPAFSSHMRYLLIEKVDESRYEAELIERGLDHRKSAFLSFEQIKELLHSTIALRYKFGSDVKRDLRKNFPIHSGLLDLGKQKTFNNCVITNLFAAIQVVRSRQNRNDFAALCKLVKQEVVNRYGFYENDFYPLGNMHACLSEIVKRKDALI